MCLQYKSFENTVGKGEITRNEQFLLFTQCFLPCYRSFCDIHQIQNCRLQTFSIWKSLKFVVWERVNSSPNVVLADYKICAAQINVTTIVICVLGGDHIEL